FDTLTITERGNGPARRSTVCVAGPENVGCDFCTGRKRKALKSCLQCQLSYYQEHIQPHYEGPLKKHRLVEASKLHENICSRHNQVKNIFCCTDKQCICLICFTTEHKDHNIVPVSEEATKKEEELKKTRQVIQQRIQRQEKDVNALRQTVDAVNRSADKAVEESEEMSNELIKLIKKMSSAVKDEIRLQQKIEVSRAKELQDKLQHEITVLKTNKADLEKLSPHGDPIQFLHKYPSLTPLPKSTTLPSLNGGPLQYFEEVTASVSEAGETLRASCSKEWNKISRSVTEVNVLPLPQLTTRAELLQYAAKCFKLDQNTASMKMLLSEGNRKATGTKVQQPYAAHADRFMSRSQALCKTSLTERHYWEVEWSGLGVSVAVAYRDIARAGKKSVFGDNDMSWALEVLDQGSIITYNFKHKRISKKKSIPKPRSSRVGVLLDHKEGILYFYRISETLSFTLLYKVQTEFKQPLHAGLGVYFKGSTAKFCEIRQGFSSPPPP
ncbi:E3 ubiquitin-protein ligase TRIM16-like, partial [Pungitius pungitius]|uniref:E3 ubiquitin-protein ligase TRIM16-like n=1 Tax=Pungitius pungitius TaxID=134920 RepID=UPI002E10EA38